MSNNTFNLDEQVGKDYFEMSMGGFNYKMFYPSSRDLMKIQEESQSTANYQSKIEQLTVDVKTETDAEKRKELEAELGKAIDSAKSTQETYIDWCCNYIKPEVEDAPNFKETLLSKNIKYLLAFVQKVQKELGEA